MDTARPAGALSRLHQRLNPGLQHSAGYGGIALSAACGFSTRLLASFPPHAPETPANTERIRRASDASDKKTDCATPR